MFSLANWLIMHVCQLEPCFVNLLSLWEEFSCYLEGSDRGNIGVVIRVCLGETLCSGKLLPSCVLFKTADSL